MKREKDEKIMDERTRDAVEKNKKRFTETYCCNLLGQFACIYLIVLGGTLMGY